MHKYKGGNKHQDEEFFGGSIHSSQEAPEAPVPPDKARNSWLIDTQQRLGGSSSQKIVN